MSVLLNADRISSDIMVQVADTESGYGLGAWQARAEAGRSFEIYVYPGEFHYKHQLAHRLAIYERNIDWFDFWLEDRRSEDSDRAADIARWERIRQPPAAEGGGEGT